MKALRIKYAIYKRDQDNKISYVDLDCEFTDSDVFAEKFKTEAEAKDYLSAIKKVDDDNFYKDCKVGQIRTVLIEEEI